MKKYFPGLLVILCLFRAMPVPAAETMLKEPTVKTVDSAVETVVKDMLEREEEEKKINELLDALKDPVYRSTYEALRKGEILQKGSRGETAEGLQKTLAAFGQDIKADGSVGPKTIGALNAVRAAFNLEKTEKLDAEGYAAILRLLLLYVDEEAAGNLISDDFGESYDYMRACAFALQGRYFSARRAFEKSGYGDWEERAGACVQTWPDTGEIYRNSDVGSGSAELSVQYNGDSDSAILIKIYTSEGNLARTMFIGGTGSAATALPSGAYTIKDGVGRNWYGEKETFGAEAAYEIMTFSDGQEEVYLAPNSSSLITVNVQEYNPDADFVGSDHESWEGFSEDT